MAKLEFSGMDEYIKMLRTMEGKTTGLIKRAVYDGAAEVAKAVKGAIEGLPETDGYTKPYNLPIKGVTAAQKRGLLDGMGLSPMGNDGGFINTKLGFDGYNSVKTKQHPNGQPNALIARSINSGSSSRQKIPFVNNAVKSAKASAEKAMSSRFDADLKTITKG